MDPINLITAINLFVSMSANWGGAKKGLKTSITKVIERPVTYLQKTPPNVAALVFVLIILGLMKVGVLADVYQKELLLFRIIGLIVFIVFSWIQIYSYKSLGKSYTQDIVILKDHKLISIGIYKYLRHPQYISQILSDLGAGIALLSYLIIPIVLFIQLPLFILRAKEEEKLLEKYFKKDFSEYKKKSGFFIPFIG